MKKLSLFCILTLVISQMTFSQTYGWKDISANIPDFPFDTLYNDYDDTIVANLTDVYFINDLEGWITTWHPNNDTSAILHTTDGGETFEVQLTEYPCNAIHMLNENEGYAGGNSGFVYRTTNGGENWIHHGSIGSTLTSINFPPVGDTGYCTGFDGTFARITPMGVTLLESNVNGDLYDICFPVNKTEGKACGGDLLRTIVDEVLTGNQGYPLGGYYAIYMVDNNKGCSVGTKIIHTEDGVNWFDQGVVLTQALLSVYFLSDQRGWAVGSGGTIFQTSNGGIDWNVEGAGLSTAILNAVHFTSPTNGYVVGNEKTLLKYGEISGIGDEIVETIQFDIFPNPAKNKVEFRSSEFATKNCSIKICDLNGKTLIEKEMATGLEKVEIDVSNLASGVYFCTLKTNKGNATKKLIIQK